MHGVEHSVQVHVRDTEIRASRLVEAEIIGICEVIWFCYACVGNDGIDTAVWGEFQGLFEEGNLRVPL